MKGIGTMVFEDQHSPAALAYEIQRPNRPWGVEMIFQAVFVREPIETRVRRVFGGDKNDNDGAPIATGFVTRRSVEDALAVLPQRLHLAEANVGLLRFRNHMAFAVTDRVQAQDSPQYSPRSAKEPAFIFRITWPRCAFTVISLMPSSKPTCLFSRPRTTNAMTSRSRGLNDAYRSRSACSCVS